MILTRTYTTVTARLAVGPFRVTPRMTQIVNEIQERATWAVLSPRRSHEDGNQIVKLWEGKVDHPTGGNNITVWLLPRGDESGAVGYAYTKPGQPGDIYLPMDFVSETVKENPHSLRRTILHELIHTLDPKNLKEAPYQRYKYNQALNKLKNLDGDPQGQLRRYLKDPGEQTAYEAESTLDFLNAKDLDKFWQEMQDPNKNQYLADISYAPKRKRDYLIRLYKQYQQAKAYQIEKKQKAEQTKKTLLPIQYHDFGKTKTRKT